MISILNVHFYSPNCKTKTFREQHNHNYNIYLWLEWNWRNIFLHEQTDPCGMTKSTVIIKFFVMQIFYTMLGKTVPGSHFSNAASNSPVSKER